MSKKLRFITYTDPMMGLTYEMQPVYRQLEAAFSSQIEFDWVMGGLVRDVYDWVNPSDLAISQTQALKHYLPRLASIYLSEEAIGGLPIVMDNFRVFDRSHTSTFPLNRAVKAMQQLRPDRAENFLYRLRFATVAETRHTTHTEEILRVVRQVGIDEILFLEAFSRESTAQAVREDWKRFDDLGVRGLPVYELLYDDQRFVFSGVLSFQQMLSLIDQATKGQVKPKAVFLNQKTFENLLAKHPLISRGELIAVFQVDEKELSLYVEIVRLKLFSYYK